MVIVSSIVLQKGQWRIQGGRRGLLLLEIPLERDDPQTANNSVFVLRKDENQDSVDEVLNKFEIKKREKGGCASPDNEF
jgi:hypothetical protein